MLNRNRLLPVHVRHPANTFRDASHDTIADLRARATPGLWGAVAGQIIGHAETPMAGMVLRYGAEPNRWPDSYPGLAYEWEVEALYYGGPMIAEGMSRADAAFVVALANAWPTMGRQAKYGAKLLGILLGASGTPIGELPFVNLLNVLMRYAESHDRIYEAELPRRADVDRAIDTLSDLTALILT